MTLPWGYKEILWTRVWRRKDAMDATDRWGWAVALRRCMAREVAFHRVRLINKAIREADNGK